MVSDNCKKTPFPILTLLIPVVWYSKSTCSFYRVDPLDQLKLSFSPSSIFLPTPDLLEWARHLSRHPQQAFGNHSAYQQKRESMSSSTSKPKAVPAALLSFNFIHPFPKAFILWLYHSVTSSWQISLSHCEAPFPRETLSAVVWQTGQSLNWDLPRGRSVASLGQGCLFLSPRLLPSSTFSSIWTQTAYKESIAHTICLVAAPLLHQLQLRRCPTERGGCHVRWPASKSLHQPRGTMLIIRHTGTPPDHCRRGVPSARREPLLSLCMSTSE